MTRTEQDNAKGRFRLVVDGQEHRIDQAQLTGVEIWALFGVDPHMELVVEGAGYEGADKVLDAADVLELDENELTHVFSRPPTNFG